MSTCPTLLPVIIYGGAGSRLWPLSRRDEPKQFAKLIGETSLFQDTLHRFDGPSFLPPAIICNASHLHLIKQQAEEIGIALGPIVMEPFGRNTAACGMIAARLGQQARGAKAVLMIPSDHHITKPSVFADIVHQATPLTEKGFLVTFGIQPTHPHTGFGYIERGDARGPGHLIYQFHEKPSLETAKEYLHRGTFFWNAGIFMFDPESLLAEFSQ